MQGLSLNLELPQEPRLHLLSAETTVGYCTPLALCDSVDPNLDDKYSIHQAIPQPLKPGSGLVNNF